MPNISHPYQETILINDSYLMSLIADISAAKISIDLETYIFEDDTVGRAVTDALCQASAHGVRVRVLVDGIGTPGWGGQLTKQMENAGIQTRVFHPLPWLVSHWHRSTRISSSIIAMFLKIISRLNNRNHRKTCIIDGKIIYIGSANITRHLSSRSNCDIWRDTNIKITGADITDILYAFDKAWNGISRKRQLNKPHPNPIFRLNHSWQLRHIHYKLLLDKIARSRNRIWVTNAYFVPDYRLLKKLIRASKNGIDVKILLPQKSDVAIASLAATTFYSTLMKYGILIYEYLPSMLHAKILIIDDWFSVGSSNLNYRSLRHDLEIDVTIQTDEARQMLERQFLDDLSNSRLIDKNDLRSHSLFKKILGQLILLFRYWI
jgi:cardiolipin synthase